MMDGDFDLELDDGAEHAEAIVACLGDDAGHLRLENPESEIAANMDAAAALIEQLLGQVALLEREKDGAYLERNQVVAALAKCFPAGVARTAIDGWSEDWHGCIYIDLPTGQASWHFHDSQAGLFAGQALYPGAWDGHTTAEKYERLARLEPMPWRAGLMSAGWLASGMHLITHEEVRLAHEAGFEVQAVFKVKGGAAPEAPVPLAASPLDYAGDLDKAGYLVVKLENVNQRAQWVATSNWSRRMVVGQSDPHEALRLALADAAGGADHG